MKSDDVPQEGEILVSPARIPTDRFFGHLLELFGREIGRICDGPQTWDEWRFDVPDDLPVYAIEELVLFDLVYSQTTVWGGYEAREG